MANTHSPAAPAQCWSADEECFRYDSLEELLQNEDLLEAGATVFFGDAEHPELSEFCDAADIIEQIGERAYDNYSEWADGFPDVSKEAEAELDALLLAWMQKHCTVTFYRVANVQKYVVTAEDIAEAHGETAALSKATGEQA